MGVAIPDDFRKEMAMAGDWQTLSETPVYKTNFKREEDVDVKSDTLSTGVRKRRYEGQEEYDEASEPAVRKAWGSTFRTYAEAGETGDDDLGSLLANTTTKAKKRGEMGDITERSQASNPEGISRIGKQSQPDHLLSEGPSIKRENSGGGTRIVLNSSETNNTTLAIKQEDDPPAPAVVFKKRKVRAMRQI